MNYVGKIPAVETTTPLSADAAYTSDWVNISNYESIIFAVKADVPGTVYAQFSNLGTEGSEDSVPSQISYTVVANTNEVHRLLRTREFFRVRHVNGNSAQSSFHIQAFTGIGGVLTSALSSTVQQDSDALITRQIPTSIDIATGGYQGYSILNKFGRNSDIDTDTDPEDVWEGGGIYTGQPVGSAETVQVFSSDANDTSAGSGARTIRIIGLDANNLEQQEDLTLNGTTAVTSTGTFNRVFRMVILTAGSGQQNAGIITTRHSTTTANIFGSIPIGRNQSQIAAYTVPANKTLYITHIDIKLTRSNGSSGSASIFVAIREPGAIYRHAKAFEVSTSQSYVYTPSLTSFKVDSESDIKIGVASVSDSNSIVSAEFEGILVENT